jgi:glycosyltransferase involved in cell wall biosynthesis
MRAPLWVTLCCLLIPLQVPRFRNFDVFFGANQPGPWFAAVLGRLLGKPSVIYLAQALRILHPRAVDRENGIRIREGDTRFINALTRSAGWLIDRLDRLTLRMACAVLTNGEHVARWIRQVYGVQSIVCPAGCHPLPPDQLRYPLRWAGATELSNHTIPRPFILLTNRHSPMKRFEYALWALKTIRKQHPEARLVITGQETEYTAQLRYLARGLGLGEAVHFVGLVKEPELRRLYCEAAVYVYPSPEEDFGMGIVEAMAAGTPVVAWGNGGPTVTVRSGETGILVPPYDASAFAGALARLLGDPALNEKMGRAGHRRAAEFFSYARHVQTLEAVLLRAVRAPFGAFSPEEANVPGAP